MDLLNLIVPLVFVGLLLWVINTFIPMEDNIKKLLNVAVIIIVVLWFIATVLPQVKGIRLGSVSSSAFAAEGAGD